MNREQGSVRSRLLAFTIVVVAGSFLWHLEGPKNKSKSGTTETAKRDWRGELVRQFDVRDRAAWRAAPPSLAISRLGKLESITVHHSAVPIPRGVSADRVSATIRAIQREHQVSRGWADIGYHYIIDPSGALWEGRNSQTIGAHAGSTALNRGNLGVLLLGNFEKHSPSAAQISALGRFVEIVGGAANIPPSRLRGHGEVRASAGLSSTACPGARLADKLPRLRTRLRGAERGSPAPALGTTLR